MLKIGFLALLYYLRHKSIKSRDSKFKNKQAAALTDEFYLNLAMNSERSINSTNSDKSFKLAESRRSMKNPADAHEKSPIGPHTNIESDVSDFSSYAQGINQFKIDENPYTKKDSEVSVSDSTKSQTKKSKSRLTTEYFLDYFLNHPEFDRSILRIISFEIVNSIFVFLKTRNMVWENSSVTFKVIHIISLVVLVALELFLLSVFLRIFFFKGKTITL